MDTHLRPYFSIPAQIPSSVHPNSVLRSTQMEVDSALYSHALEVIDSPLSKKLFVDLVFFQVLSAKDGSHHSLVRSLWTT